MGHSEWFDLAKATMLARNPLLREETIDLEGTTLNMTCHAIAACADEAEAQQAIEAEGNYLDTARGDALTRLVASDYGVQRKGATSAVVTLTLSRTGGGDITVPAGSVFATSDGVRFTLDLDLEWLAGGRLPLNATATSVTVGPGVNVAADSIQVVESTLDDATIVVTNVEPAAGGSDDETDEELVARVRDVEARAVRGVAEAIRLGALTVARVRSASVYEAVDAEGVPTGGGVMVIADSVGQANQALIDEVTEAIKEYRPLGGYVDVTGATVDEVTIIVAAVWEPGKGTPANAAALKSAVVARVNRLASRAAPSGADSSSYADAILDQSAIAEVRPLVTGLRKVTMTLPVGTTTPDAGHVIRTRASLVTVV